MPPSFFPNAFLLLLLCLAFQIQAEPATKHAETTPGSTGPPPPEFNSDETRTTLDQSALGFLIKANGMRVPATELEWSQALAQHGSVRSTWVPFSASPARTSLLEPRLVLTALGPPKRANGLNLEGQLFVAIIPRRDGTKELEFISRNRTTGAFDFGIIRNFGSPGRMVVELADKAKCMVCHRSGGPLFSVTPWSQTLTNPAMLRAFAERLGTADPRQYGAFHREVERLAADAEKSDPKLALQLSHFESALEQSPIVRRTTFQGIPIFPARHKPEDPSNSVSDLDAAVSLANRALRVRELLGAIPTADIRRKANRLAGEVALRWTLGDETGATAALAQLKTLLLKNKFPIARLAALQPFRMNDFNPAFPDGVRKFGEGIGEVDEYAGQPFRPESMRAIRTHNALREEGNLTLPKSLLASDPSSLDAKPLTFEEVVDGLSLETVTHAVGLHELDPAPFTPLLNELAAQPGKSKKQITESLLSSEALAPVLGGAGFPRREELLQALHLGLGTLARGHGLRPPRTETSAFVPSVYSMPFARRAGTAPAAMAAGAPSDRCLTCHIEIRKPMRFAPDDREAWRRWLASEDVTERTKARDWLRKVRLALEDRSMPPPDSTELEGFEPRRRELLLLLRELEDRPPTEMPK